jgi:pSer/pThr/pTyr-binding forkhead associated (FHA) protein
MRGNFILEDNKSFNGTLVNDQRISAPTPLYDGDRIQLGTVRPVLRFVAPGGSRQLAATLAGQRAIAINQDAGNSAAGDPA